MRALALFRPSFQATAHTLAHLQQLKTVLLPQTRRGADLGTACPIQNVLGGPSASPTPWNAVLPICSRRLLRPSCSGRRNG